MFFLLNLPVHSDYFYFYFSSSVLDLVLGLDFDLDLDWLRDSFHLIVVYDSFSSPKKLSKKINIFSRLKCVSLRYVTFNLCGVINFVFIFCTGKMGIDLIAGGRRVGHNVRKSPVSQDVYLRLLVKLYRFLFFFSLKILSFDWLIDLYLFVLK